jgi:hypothetical protein
MLTPHGGTCSGEVGEGKGRGSGRSAGCEEDKLRKTTTQRRRETTHAAGRRALSHLLILHTQSSANSHSPTSWHTHTQTHTRTWRHTHKYLSLPGCEDSNRSHCTHTQRQTTHCWTEHSPWGCPHCSAAAEQHGAPPPPATPCSWGHQRGWPQTPGPPPPCARQRCLVLLRLSVQCAHSSAGNCRVFAC